MAILPFRVRPALRLHSVGTVAVPSSRKERLAVVSTSNKLCGIAAYTAALERQLRDLFEVTVFDLDQYLLRSSHARVRKLGDRHIKQICRELARFDAVNLQLEHGTLGRDANDIYRRFGWLLKAAPRLSVTFHTLLTPPAFDYAALCRALIRLNFAAALRVPREFYRNQLLSVGLAARLRRAQRVKPVSAIVHNGCDLKHLKYLYGVDAVFDHPLAFLSAAEVETVRGRASRRSFAMLESLPDNAVLTGVFGFLNDYKGVATAIRSLHHLPNNHHLLVFGGLHPNEIAPRQPIHGYVAKLFDEAYVDTSLYERAFQGRQQQDKPGVVLEGNDALTAMLGPHPRDLSARIHFMGVPDDRDFLAGMAVCDAVVLPYLEVGQSSSGPISQALELGCRIIASRTRTFLEFGKYHPERIEFFDIGNHLELAERILARRQFGPRQSQPDFNVETNKTVYLLANSAGRPSPPGAAEHRSLVPVTPDEQLTS